MASVARINPFICKTPKDFADQLRAMADRIECGHGMFDSPVQEMVILSKHEDGVGMRWDCLGSDLRMMEIIGMVEFVKLTMFDMI